MHGPGFVSASGSVIFIVALLLSLNLGCCSKPPEAGAPVAAAAPADRLVGNWHTITATHTIDYEIERVSQNQVRITSRLNTVFRGVYTIKGEIVVMETPVTPSMAGLEWHIESDDKLVVATNANQGSGSNYIGHEMTRLAPGEVPALTPRPTVARRGPAVIPSKVAPMPTPEAPLSGNWRFTARNGTFINMQIAPAENSQYVISALANTVFSGTYEVKGDKFVMVTSSTPDMKGLEWHIDSNDKMVIVTNAKPGSGGNYLGMSMARITADLAPTPETVVP